MTPREALQMAVQAAFVSSSALKPGAIISRLGKDVREALKDLKYDDAANVRL